MISVQLLIVTACIATVFANCPHGWMEFQDSCYLFSNDTDTWVNARLMCQWHGADLISIETQAEQDEFKKIAETYGHTNDDDGFWLSATDFIEEGKWVWEATGQEVTWSAWGQRQVPQPNNRDGHENCMVAVKFFEYAWSDEFCDWSHHIQYVCERPAHGPGPIVVG